MISGGVIKARRDALDEAGRDRARAFGRALTDWRIAAALAPIEAAGRLRVGAGWLELAERHAIDPHGLSPSFATELRQRTGIETGAPAPSADRIAGDLSHPGDVEAALPPAASTPRDGATRRVRAVFEVPGTIAIAIGTSEDRLTLEEAARLQIALKAALRAARAAHDASGRNL